MKHSTSLAQVLTNIVAAIRSTLFFTTKYLGAVFGQWWAWVGLLLDLIALGVILGLFSDSTLVVPYTFTILSIFLIATVLIFRKESFRTISKPTNSFYGHTYKVNNINFSENGEAFVSCSDRVALIWKPSKSDEETQRLVCDTWIGNAVFANSGKLVIGIGGKGNLFVWDTKTSMLRRKMKAHTGDSVALAYNQAANVFASGGKEGILKLWNGKNFKKIKQKKLGDAEIRKIVFDSQMRLLVCDVAGTVHSVSPNLTKAKKIFEHPTRKSIRAIAVSHARNLLAIADAGGWLRLIDLHTGVVVSALHAHEGMALCCQFDRTGKFIASGGQDNKVRLWKIRSSLRRYFTISGHEAPVISLAFDPRSNNLLSGSRDTVIRQWNLDYLLY